MIKYDEDSDIGKYEENCSQCWKYIHRGWDKCGCCDKEFVRKKGE